MRSVLIFLYCALTLLVHGQQVINFDYQDYGGEAQNWAVSQNTDGNLFFANEGGLLRFNGSDWELLKASDFYSVKAVCCIGERVYAAGNNNIGYWTKEKTGEFKYTSLLPLLAKSGVKEHGVFWAIASDGKRVYFQEFGQILMYDGQRFHIVGNDFYSTFCCDHGRIFTQHSFSGLYEIKNHREQLVSNDARLQNHIVRFVFEKANHQLIIGFIDGEVCTLTNTGLHTLCRLTDANGGAILVECGTRYAEDDHKMAVATSDGVYLLDIDSKEIHRLPKGMLQDLKCTALLYASHDDLWGAYDFGISRFQLYPLLHLWCTNQEIGKFYDAVHYLGGIYHATGKGLYINNKLINKNILPIKFYAIKDALLCGTESKQLLVKTGPSPFSTLLEVDGASQFEYVAENGQEFLFIKYHEGIVILKWLAGKWQQHAIIHSPGDYFQIMPENPTVVWALEPEKGIYRIRLTSNQQSVERADTFKLVGKEADLYRVRLFKVDNKTWFTTSNGIYYYDEVNHQFEYHKNLSEQIRFSNQIRDIIPAGSHTFWVAENEELCLYRISDQNAKLEYCLPFTNPKLMLKDGRLNIATVGDSVYIPTFEGPVILNLNRLKSAFSQQIGIRLEAIRYMADEHMCYAALDGKIVIPNDASNIEIRLSAGIHEFAPSYSFRLKDIQSEWSPWQSSGVIRFTNLSPGSYKLELKDNIGNTREITFRVQAPFLLRWPMILLYILVLICATSLIVYSTREKKLRRIRMEMAEEKVKNQEGQLKTQMRYLTQKQELLESISSEIESQKQALGDRYPNKMYQKLKKIIKEGTTEEDKLHSFENYFVDVHYEFMLRMQQAYPSLSASELRFCCLLRANLSTKEIGAIIGITTHSVEIKKYRLKQKLAFEGDDNLISFILNF